MALAVAKRWHYLRSLNVRAIRKYFIQTTAQPEERRGDRT